MKYLVTLLIITITGSATLGLKAQEKIKWYDFEKAVELNKKKPKKFFLDMYTDWCGWCKKMDQTTFADPVIASYMNENFYPVKFDAERKDTIVFKGEVYVNTNPTGRRSSHQLAQMLMQGRMSYPSFIFLNEKAELITKVPGYRKSPEFEPILHFIGENAYIDQKWEQFTAGFQGSY